MSEDTAAEVTWPVTVKLAYPVAFGNETIDSLTFRRGSLGILKGLKIDSSPNAEQAMTIASRLCAQPLKVIESLDPEDAGEVLALALLFFARCLGAGKTP